MAKRLTPEDVDAWVSIEGRRLEQFDAQWNEAQTEFTCWIASEIGKEFSLHIIRKPRWKYDCCAIFSLDGQEVPSWKHLRKAKKNVEKSLTYFRVSDLEVRNFSFGSLQLTEDEVPGSDSLTNLGELRIVLEEGLATRLKNFRNFGTCSAVEQNKVNERSKKAVTHHVKYGETQRKLARGEGLSFEPLANSIPLTFIFRYRPLAVLQASGIAPRSSHDKLVPSRNQHSSARKRKADEHIESGDEREEALTRVEQKLLAELEVVRKMKRTKPDPNVKREPEHTSLLRGEIIDLT